MSPSVFTAIGDARRRRILELLRARDRAVGELADELGIAQPSVTQHLGILREVGLVTARRDGTRSVYSVTPGALDEVTAWIASIADPAE